VSSFDAMLHIPAKILHIETNETIVSSFYGKSIDGELSRTQCWRILGPKKYKVPKKTGENYIMRKLII